MSEGLQQAVDLTARGSRMARRILGFPTPVIAVSTGHCVAMGAFLMLACDYRIGLLGNYKIGLNETSIGMTMHHFGIELARYRLPKNYFGRCVINAEMYNPEHAVTVGFYDCIAQPESLNDIINVVTANFAKLDTNAFKRTKNKSRRDILELLDRCIEADLVIPTV
jgi:enoyl-CoA hydratase